jgi:hypothetical protein
MRFSQNSWTKNLREWCILKSLYQSIFKRLSCKSYIILKIILCRISPYQQLIFKIWPQEPPFVWVSHIYYQKNRFSQNIKMQLVPGYGGVGHMELLHCYWGYWPDSLGGSTPSWVNWPLLYRTKFWCDLIDSLATREPNWTCGWISPGISIWPKNFGKQNFCIFITLPKLITVKI